MHCPSKCQSGARRELCVVDLPEGNGADGTQVRGVRGDHQTIQYGPRNANQEAGVGPVEDQGMDLGEALTKAYTVYVQVLWQLTGHNNSFGVRVVTPGVTDEMDEEVQEAMNTSSSSSRGTQGHSSHTQSRTSSTATGSRHPQGHHEKDTNPNRSPVHHPA